MKKLILFLTVLLISEFLSAQTVDLEKISVSNYDEKVINDPSIDYGKFKTYSLISSSVLFENKTLTLEEKQIEFFLVNVFYGRLKLKYIPFNDSIKPDLMFIYSFSNDYKEKYIAPQTYSMPIWSRGETTKINSNSATNVNTYGDLNIYGNVNGNKITTITKSGKWELAQVQRPGYTEGQFFPNFSLTIYETSNNNKIWEGSANGTTSQKDFRLAAQSLIWSLKNKIPHGSGVFSISLENNNGQSGIGFELFNSTGVSFYPIIFYIFENSPAEKKGLKNFDIILAINGESTANKSVIQIIELLSGNVGTVIDLIIERKGKQIKKSLVKEPR